MQLTVYVPNPATRPVPTVDPGSGIVGRPADEFFQEMPGVTERAKGDEELVIIDYEGARYRPSNIQTFADKVLHAAGRHEQRYPTVARSLVKRDWLIPVGTYDTASRELDVQDAVALANWLDVTVTELVSLLAFTS